MINVTYDARNYVLEIDGHANSAEYGKDLVCCAVSTLSYCLEAHLSRHEDYGATVVRKEREAHFLAAAHPKRKCEDRCSEAFEEIMDGMRILQSNYPDYIKIEERVDQ